VGAREKVEREGRRRTLKVERRVEKSAHAGQDQTGRRIGGGWRRDR
jgi:hypothetical protein